jgi:plastocyanin
MSVRQALLLATLVAATACSDDDGDGGQEPAEGDILVRNNFFDPGTFEVAPGATVVWGWSSGGVSHNVTFTDGESSGNQTSGTYQRTFAEAGSYPYHCTIHGTPTSGMRGSVTVTAPAGGEGNGSGDDGGSGGDNPGGSPY